MKQDELTIIYNEIEYNWEEYNRINEILNNEKEYINELSTKKLEIKNRIYELSDKINICDNSLSKDNSESKIDLKDEKIQKIEPYIMYEQKEKVLKREINRSINKRSIYYK